MGGVLSTRVASAASALRSRSARRRRGSTGTAAPGLSRDEQARLDVFGYLVLRGLMATEVGALTAGFDAVLRGGPAKVLDCPQFYAPVSTWEAHPRVGLLGALDRSPALARLRTDPRVRAIVDQVVGPDHVATDTVSAFSCDTHWHHDGLFGPRPGRHVLFLWYLDALTADSGALRVLPGSHLPGPYRDALEADLTRAPVPLPSAFGLPADGLPGVALDVEPGDAVVLDLRLFHASFHGGAGRRVVTVAFGPREDEADRAVAEGASTWGAAAPPAAVARLLELFGRER